MNSTLEDLAKTLTRSVGDDLKAKELSIIAKKTLEKIDLVLAK